jgi:hypothetical protein
MEVTSPSAFTILNHPGVPDKYLFKGKWDKEAKISPKGIGNFLWIILT